MCHDDCGLRNVGDADMTEIRSEGYYKCYHCIHFSTNEHEYLKHGVQNHLYKRLFPNETELKDYNLKPQNKPSDSSIGTSINQKKVQLPYP